MNTSLAQMDEAAGAAQTNWVETEDGTRLFVSDRGTGRPVVLIHGWAMGSGMWEYQVPDLIGGGLRTIVYDQRGCGRSDHAAHGYDFNTLADDLASVLAQLDIADATLVGFSLGGGVVARYLARHGSARVAGAVLVGSNTPCLLRSETNPEGMEPGMVYEGFLQGLREDRPALLAATAPAFFGTGATGIAASPEIVRWALGLCFQSDAYGMLELYRAVNHTDFRPDMAAFDVPTLVLHGDLDPFQPLAYTGQRTAALIRGSRLHVYEGASHGLFYTHKERMNRDILEFVRGRRRGSWMSLGSNGSAEPERIASVQSQGRKQP